MPPFLHGLELATRYTYDHVLPALHAYDTTLRCSAALIGPGSEVLGLDTPMSSDHDWGPRTMIFLRPEDLEVHRVPLQEHFRASLPATCCAWPTRFVFPNPTEMRTRHLVHSGDAGEPCVELHSPRAYVQSVLGWDPLGLISPAHWLSTPQQKLLSLTSGRVFHDELGLQELRDILAYPPHDVWLLMIAAGWARIGEHEHLLGRADSVGDALGASLIAASITRDLMYLTFLFARVYAPYAKWFGSMFATLPESRKLHPLLIQLTQARDVTSRQDALSAALSHTAHLHNMLSVTGEVPTETRSFFGRPYRVLGGQTLAEITIRSISDPAVLLLASRGPLASIDQCSDDTRLREDETAFRRFRALYTV